MVDGPQRASFTHPTYCNVAILPVVTWDLPVSPRSRLTNLDREESSALLQLVNEWLKFTFSRSHTFRYGRQNKHPALTRIEPTTSVLLAGVRDYLLEHSGEEGIPHVYFASTTYCRRRRRN